MRKRKKKEIQPFEALKEKKYRITFPWIDKNTEAQVEENNIQINSTLLHVDCFIHELYHKEGEGFPGLYDEEEVVVELRTKKYLKKLSVREYRAMGRIIIEKYYIPYLVKRYRKAVEKALAK